ncbi:hypothetical protein F4809DRAFT_657798 [Biscogniauxia mediterranea]|nr:hypothetical protein F4809DRAFT_657798 [Biscogniauxia mediterranea]
MDPFAALGVASSIVNFVDFACKLFAETREIYRSASGTAEQNLLLEDISRNVLDISAGLSHCPSNQPRLKNISKQCESIAKDLLETLDTLRLQGEQSKWQSFRIALREIRKKSEIDRLADSLAKVQMHIVLYILSQLQNDNSEIAKSIKHLQDATRDLGTQAHQDLQHMKDSIVEEIKGLIIENSKSTKLHTVFESQRNMQNVDDELISDATGRIQRLSQTMKALELITTQALSSNDFLRNLHFQTILARQDSIEAAHGETFSWVFNDVEISSSGKPAHKFVKWLREEHGVYWIQGKAGSGKSTLMKYISNDHRLRLHLEKWAGEKKLYIGSYYFWSAGASLQKSQGGLLRTLLYNILSECTDLIPLARDTMAKLCGFQSKKEQWGLEELLSIYRTVLSQKLETKFCFLIDGLDEFEEANRDHADLFRTLRSLQVSPDVKLCVSSRPWTIFYDEFGDSPDRQLQLHDWTKDDIVQYVQDKFNDHKQFRKLKETDRDYEDLITQVSERAQGFSFGYTSLLRAYWKHMIDSIPKAYQVQAARTFKIATAAEEPELLMFYVFLDAAVENELPIVFEWNSGLPEKEVVDCQNRMRRQLDARSKGLLDIYPDDSLSQYFRLRVQFLHRTVRDFILERKLFREDLIEGEKLHMFACQAALAQLKITQYYLGYPYSNYLRLVFAYCQKAIEMPGSISDLLSILENAKTYWGDPTDLPRVMEFYGLAAQYDLLLFFEQKREKRLLRTHLTNRKERPILDYVLQGISGHSRRPATMVTFLLENGAPPNQPYGSATVWTRFLAKMKLEYSKKGTLPRAYCEVTRIMLSYGADPDEVVEDCDHRVLKFAPKSRNPRERHMTFKGRPGATNREKKETMRTVEVLEPSLTSILGSKVVKHSADSIHGLLRRQVLLHQKHDEVLLHAKGL